MGLIPGQLDDDLMRAVEGNRLEDVRALLCKGADPNHSFGLAMMNKNIPICLELLEMESLRANGAFVARRHRYYADGTGEYTFLSYAASKNMVEVIRALIHKGALIDGQVYGNTALMLAAKHGKTKAVTELLLYDGHSDISLNWALRYAAEYGRTPSIKILLQYLDDTNLIGDVDLELALSKAIEKGHCNAVALLAGRVADINKAISGDFTPLMFAVWHESNINVIKTLLEQGADPNIVSSRGRTALGCALFNCLNVDASTDVVSVLLEAGADPKLLESL